MIASLTGKVKELEQEKAQLEQKEGQLGKNLLSFRRDFAKAASSWEAGPRFLRQLGVICGDFVPANYGGELAEWSTSVPLVTQDNNGPSLNQTYWGEGASATVSSTECPNGTLSPLDYQNGPLVQYHGPEFNAVNCPVCGYLGFGMRYLNLGIQPAVDDTSISEWGLPNTARDEERWMPL